jgi:DNA (cytosine-5)-methyltransferase 1
MALGFENAGFQTLLLNEYDKHACASLRLNRPQWNVIQGDVAALDFREYRGKVDVLAGGFPCQAFSYAGKGRAFGDPRGTLFYQYARAVDDCRPCVAVAENVKGLITHDEGRTLATIREHMAGLGYVELACEILQAHRHGVGQKRERLFLVWSRADLAAMGVPFSMPEQGAVTTLRDALMDVPASDGAAYPPKKAAMLDMVPPGGNWRNLPEGIRQDYIGDLYKSGGCGGFLRRLAWDEPCLTVLTCPSQRMTERCHPDETRPLTIRESARVQSFPDDWGFSGGRAAQYKQIGNAVPPRLAERVADKVRCWLVETLASSEKEAA